MPQGKGTYGSQVGRPKKKYNKGGSVSMNADPFSTRNEEGVPAEQMAEAMETQNMANEGLPTANAQERSQVSPDVEQYKDGGKVSKWKRKGASPEEIMEQARLSKFKKVSKDKGPKLQKRKGESSAEYYKRVHGHRKIQSPPGSKK